MINRVKIIFTVIVSVLVVGCSYQDDEAFEVPLDGNVDQVEGLGYTENDDGLYFATRTGLKIYRNNKWFETSTNSNDYVGFAALDKGFYLSGYPETDSILPNPIGLQRSYDGGKSFEDVDFEGEDAFDVMAAGYNSHDVIIFNEQKTFELEEGVFLSEDNGKSWTEVNASGLDGDIISFSIHPSNSKYIAAASNRGVYLSRDKGDNFTRISDKGAVGTVVFMNEKNLYFGSYDNKTKLERYKLDNGKVTKIHLPELHGDAPVFVTQNPKDTEEIAIYTYDGRAYVSDDYSQTWEQILAYNEVE